MGDKDFMLAGDGWVQVTPCGEFPHVGAGVTQVIDREACDRIAADFNGRKSDANFPGVLVDFDHFSLDTEKSSEAAGWISDLESRDTGLWARVRWSDAGLSAVRGGRFRLMSPVFPPPSACEDLGGGKIRPVMLVSVALTNEPNIKGGRPIANRQVGSSLVHYCESSLVENRDGATANGANDANGNIGNRWTNVARAASLAVRREKAEARKKRSAISTGSVVSELSGDGKIDDGEGEVSRKDAKTQRLDAARAAVMRELAEKRSTLK